MAKLGRAPIGLVLRLITPSSSTTMLGSLAKKWDPFQVLIATILSARCRDEVTEPVANALFTRFPNCNTLAEASPHTINTMIHRIGFHNTKTRHIQASAKMIRDEFGGKVPTSYESLMRLPGVGRKVAGCVLVYSFGQDAIPVDTHVHRISNRLGWVRTKTPEQTEQALLKLVPRRLWRVVNDSMVAHGKSICLPVRPKCSMCLVRKWCEKRGVKTSR